MATLSVGGQVITVTVPTTNTVTVAVAPPAAFPLIASDFSLGALDINATTPNPGAVVRVQIAVQTPVDTLRKLLGGSWAPFLHDGQTGATISADGLTVTLDLKDGGRGDADGQADGVIHDPIVIGYNPTSIPVMNLGQPFSYQLQATGASGPIEWSVESGALPDGITLSPGGVISGTPTAYGIPVRLRATEGATGDTDTRLVFPVAIGGSAPTSTGAPLPEGKPIQVYAYDPPSGSGPPTAPWVGEYVTNGLLAPLASFNIRKFGGAANPEGTQLIRPADPATPGGPPTGPIMVIDALTGATIQVLDPTSTPSLGTSFSPNGAFVALNGPTEVRIFETVNWSAVRTIGTTDPSHGVYWGPDSTELILQQNPSAGGVVSVVSATDPTIDRNFNIAGQSNCSVSAWSPVTNRIALGCGGSLVTASAGTGSSPALGGTDVRVVVPTCLGTFPCVGTFGPVLFSPSGSYLVLAQLTYTSFGPPAPTATNRLVIIPDAADGTVIPITVAEPFPGGRIAFVNGWSNTP